MQFRAVSLTPSPTFAGDPGWVGSNVLKRYMRRLKNESCTQPACFYTLLFEFVAHIPPANENPSLFEVISQIFPTYRPL